MISNIRLKPGPVKQMLWRDRKEISSNPRTLFEKFGCLQLHFLKKGFTPEDARGMAFMFLAFPFMRTLYFLDEEELLHTVSLIQTIVLHYEQSCN